MRTETYLPPGAYSTLWSSSRTVVNNGIHTVLADEVLLFDVRRPNSYSNAPVRGLGRRYGDATHMSLLLRPDAENGVMSLRGRWQQCEQYCGLVACGGEVDFQETADGCYFGRWYTAIVQRPVYSDVAEGTWVLAPGAGSLPLTQTDAYWQQFEG